MYARRGRLFVFTILAMVLIGRASGADFCALTVDIVNSEGGPAKLTPVKLFDPNGGLVFPRPWRVSGFAWTSRYTLPCG
jgi:hypothetical protein